MLKHVLINNKLEWIEWNKTFFLERYLKKENPDEFKNIFEIGAYNCEESLTFTRLFPNAHITAFECNPVLLPTCRDNSRKSDRITLVEKLVTDTPEDSTFYVCDGGESSMNFPYFNHSVTFVPTTTMDEYLDDRPIDLVWIDVQGAEINVLRSFKDKLKNVKTIYCEVDINAERYQSSSTLRTVNEFLSNYTIKDMMQLNRNEMHVIYKLDV